MFAPSMLKSCLVCEKRHAEPNSNDRGWYRIIQNQLNFDFFIATKNSTLPGFPEIILDNPGLNQWYATQLTRADNRKTAESLVVLREMEKNPLDIEVAKLTNGHI
ncbi:MAG: hypothetical protein K2X93_15545 [Candidatus Obscuribacterales bacterium]|nr:hypothetical protein [Candidatus Obscuribacterales bacterium]